MQEPMWQPPTVVTIPAMATHGYWTKVLDFIDGSTWVKIWVEDVPDVAAAAAAPPAVGAAPAPAAPATLPPVWCYADKRTCSADGDVLAPINQATCLLSTAVPGSLIAKIGGSRAGRVDDGHAVVVGSFCIFKGDDKVGSGALYLTMNFDPSRPLERTGEIAVSVAVAKTVVQA
jgi:hypothetical protein